MCVYVYVRACARGGVCVCVRVGVSESGCASEGASGRGRVCVKRKGPGEMPGVGRLATGAVLVLLPRPAGDAQFARRVYMQVRAIE